MNWKKIIKRIAAGIAYLSLSTLLCALLLFGAVQTDRGRAYLVKTLQGVLAEERMRVGKVTGFIPFHFHVDHVTLADPHGEWLALGGIEVHWSPLRLFRGAFHFPRVGADTAEMKRLPERRASTPKASKAGKFWLPLLQRMRLEHFFINRLNVGKAVLGKQAAFEVRASTAGSFPGGALGASVAVRQVEGGTAVFTTDATWSPHREDLRIRARIEEPEGGVLAGTMGFEGPLHFSLEGEGTAENWNGSLIGKISPFGAMESRLHVRKVKHPEVTFSGVFRIDRTHLPELLSAWMGDEASLEFVARPQTMESLFLERFSFSTSAVSVAASGLLDLAGSSSKIDFSLASRDLSFLKVFLNRPSSGALTARGTLSGSRWRPSAALDIRLEKPALGGMRASAVESQWDVDALESENAFPYRFRVKGEGKMHDLSNTQPKMVFPKTIAWSGEADISPENPLRLTGLQLTSERISGALAGEIDLERLGGSLDVSLELDDASLPAGWLGHPLPFLGKTSLSATIKRDSEKHLVSGSLQGRSMILRKALPYAVRLPAKDITYTTAYSVERLEKIILSGVRMSMDAATLRGDIAVDIQRSMINAAWDLHLPKLDFISASLNRPLEGSLRLKGALDGPFSRIHTRLEFTGEDLRVAGEDFERVYAEIYSSGLPPHLSGRVSLDLTWRQHPLSSATHFDWEENRLNFHRFSLEGAGVTLDGRLALHLRQGVLEGALKGRSPDLSTLSFLLGGRVLGGVEINSRFRIGDEKRELGLDLKGKDLGGFGGHIQEAELNARITGENKAPSGTLSLSVSGVRLGDFRLSTAEARAESDGLRIAYSVRGKGEFIQALEFMTSGETHPFSETLDVTIHLLRASFGGIPVVLDQPATLLSSQGSVTLENFRCSLGGGRLEGGGSLKKGELRVNSRFEKLPLSLARAFWPSGPSGTASGKMTLQGPFHEPEGELEIQIEGFDLPHQLAPELPSASLALTALLENRRLRSRFSVGGLTREPFVGNFELPLELSLTPFHLALPPSGPLKGMVDGGMDLARLTSFFALHDQRVKGTARMTLALEGTPLEPNISGRIVATDVAYENYRTGTLITDAEIEIEASNRELRIKRAHGKGGVGTITAEGWMSLDSSQALPFRVDFTMHRNTVARLDEITITMSGAGKFEGNRKGVTLSGHLTTDSAEIQIPKRLPAELTEVDVVEIHEEEGPSLPDQTVLNKPPPKAANSLLDLSLAVPGRAFVRGRGLESEWQGNLSVRGKAGRPELTGKLSLVRGRFDLLSTRFELTRGFISFSGSTPPQPMLDLTGEARTKDLLAKVQVIGPIQSLEIRLFSEPPYPADEILASLLFGRRLHQITPVQAVQLVNALNALRGSEGFDLLGRTRKVLGVDELAIGTTGEKGNDPSVKIGKYVSENVYIEVESGISPDTGKASVQWHVTPNITLETEVGVNATAGAGVNWRWDY